LATLLVVTAAATLVVAAAATLVVAAAATLVVAALAALLLVAALIAPAEVGSLLAEVLSLLVATETGLLLGVEVLLVATVLQLLWVESEPAEEACVLLGVDLSHAVHLLSSLLVVTPHLAYQVDDLHRVEPHHWLLHDRLMSNYAVSRWATDDPVSMSTTRSV